MDPFAQKEPFAQADGQPHHVRRREIIGRFAWVEPANKPVEDPAALRGRENGFESLVERSIGLSLCVAYPARCVAHELC